MGDQSNVFELELPEGKVNGGSKIYQVLGKRLDEGLVGLVLLKPDPDFHLYVGLSALLIVLVDEANAIDLCGLGQEVAQEAKHK